MDAAAVTDPTPLLRPCKCFAPWLCRSNHCPHTHGPECQQCSEIELYEEMDDAL